MKKKEQILLDFIVDRLTNSIQNTISGDSFQTEVLRLTTKDLKHLTRKNGWNFDWKSELSNNAKEVFKLTIVNNPEIIQGLVSFTVESDHIFMDLLESAPYNVGKNKLYEGIPGNLVAFACKVSFQHGFNGYIAFTAKTKLIDHYTHSLGAFLLRGHRMIITSASAKFLVEKYFKS